jgi:twinkle protein
MQKRYQWVDEALAAGLNQAQAIIWCGDSDGPGLALRSDMVRVFGPAKFHFVDWPDGFKDANQILVECGQDALLRAVQGAKPWPIAGLYRMDDMPEPPQFTLWDTGFEAFEGKIKLAPRCLSVATGHPGHGKTAFWNQTWFQIARHYDLVICAASFETHIKPHMRRQLRSLYWGCLEIEMGERQRQGADRWINDHYLFLAPPDMQPTLSWMLNTAEAAVIRHGARVVTIDPWNYLESSRGPGESETEHIGKCLREMRGFAKDLNCHVMVLAHPAKMGGDRRGQAPSLEDISGSKHWDNAVDQGFVIHRPQVWDHDKGERQTGALLDYRKSRFVDELGYPLSFNLNYNLSKGRYEYAKPSAWEDDDGIRGKHGRR